MITENEAFTLTDQCILNDEQPSKGLRVLAHDTWPQVHLFDELLKQQHTEQSPVYHPEGSVWEHTLLVVDEAAKKKQYSTDPRGFMWAALLHDMGKPSATRVRKGRITAYDHDKTGAEMAFRLLLDAGESRDFARRVALLVRYHMQLLYVEKSLPFQDISGIKKQSSVSDVALLGYCDRIGRLGADTDTVGREVMGFLRKCDYRGTVDFLP